MTIANTLFPEIIRTTKSKNHGCKRCSKCGQIIALKYFSKDKSTKDGYRHTCKDCDSEQQRKCRQNMTYIQVIEKQCCECGNIKPIDQFGIDKTKKDKHRSYCLECMRLQKKHRKRTKLVKQPKSKL